MYVWIHFASDSGKFLEVPLETNKNIKSTDTLLFINISDVSVCTVAHRRFGKIGASAKAKTLTRPEKLTNNIRVLLIIFSVVFF